MALAPLFVALRSGGRGRALLAMWVWLVLACTVIANWFPGAVATYFQQPWLVAFAFFLAVAPTAAAPQYLLFALAYHALTRRRVGPWLPLLTAAAWVAAELGRIWIFVRNPWGVVGYSQMDVLPMIQIASVTGVYGISFAVVAVNAALADVLWAALRGGPAPFLRRSVALAAGPALGVLAFGLVSLADARREDRQPEIGTPVALIQADLPLGSRWRADLYGENLDAYLRLTQTAAEGGAQIAFWPEAAMTFFLEQEPVYRDGLARFVAARDLELVAGGPRAATDAASGRELHFNSVYLLGRDGAIRGRYDKQELLPFMEYFPLGVDLLRRRFGRVRDFTAGEETPLLPTRAGLAGVLNCNEALWPELAAERVAQGATFLVNPSHDAWIPRLQFARQQLDMVRLRAVEQRRDLVRASSVGPSAIVDPWGRLRVQSEPFAQAVLTGTVRAREGRTFYGRFGDAFGFACLAAVLVVLVANRASRGVV